MEIAIGTRFDRVVSQLASEAYRLTGIALARVGLGIVSLYFYLSNLRVRQFLWGPDGVIPLASLRELGPERGSWSIFRLADSPGLLDALLACGLVVALAYTLVGGRLVSLLHAIFVTGLFQRNYLITDGGDGLTMILLPLMALTINNARFSLVADKVRRRLETPRPIACMLHNVIVGAIVGQIALVYFSASLWKLGGEFWRNGTALHFIGRVDDYTLLRIPAFVLNNSFLTTALTYGIVLTQALVTPAVVLRRGREIVVPAVILMHIGIGLFMGLIGFAATMIAADLALLPDRSYERLRYRISDLTRRRANVQEENQHSGTSVNIDRLPMSELESGFRPGAETSASHEA